MKLVRQCKLRGDFVDRFTSFGLTLVLIWMGVGEAMKLAFPTESEIDCPKKTWYYNETESCWPVRQQGPCPKSMIFYPIDKIYGDCDCPEVNHSTVWVYDLASNQCFKTYQQAFCSPGEWLVLDEQTHAPVCTTNRCEELQTNSNPEENEIHPVVLFKNKCVRLLKFSEDSYCPSPSEVIIDQHTGNPICSSELLAERDIGVKGNFKCRQGTRRDRLGKCRPVTSNKWRGDFQVADPSHHHYHNQIATTMTSRSV